MGTDERLKILEMLANGRIDTEEAERLLTVVNEAEAAEGQGPAGAFAREKMEKIARKARKLGEKMRGPLRDFDPQRLAADIRSAVGGAFGGGQPTAEGVPVESPAEGFELPEEACLSVSGRGGDLTVCRSEDGLARVTCDEEVAVAVDGNALNVATTKGDVRIALPPVRECRLRFTGGDVNVDCPCTSMDVSLTGGDVRLDGCTGPVQVRATGGDCRIGGSPTGLQANVTGGDLRIGPVALTGGEHGVNSTGGDTQVTLAAGSSVRVRVSTMGGDVRSDLPQESEGGGFIGKKASYVMGDGAATLHVRCMGGDVRIKAEEAEKPAAASEEG